MNSIHSCISEVIRELTYLYKRTYNNEWKSDYILNDVYDLVISLWNAEIIEDSSVAMRLLKFYYDNKKYCFLEPADYTNYQSIESTASSQKDELIQELQKVKSQKGIL
ncbi:hypothetical protein [Paenibacillus amylolyticus]|uniref:hypothetical protein n=1 Tax=Paenibacillus amylolyticus TaxID=1451 RepID=UPI0039AEDBD7